MSFQIADQSGPKPKRVRLSPIVQEGQRFIQDYDGGSGGNYLQGGRQKVTVQSEQNKKQVAFDDEDSERAKDQLQKHPDHSTSMTHATYFQDDHFKQCYPWELQLKNFLKQALTCQNRKNTFVDHLHDLDKLNPQSSQLKDNLEEKTVSLKILGTSSLELDTNVMHPFVRIHFINMTTGCYLQKSRVQDNVVYNFESNCITEIKEGKKVPKACELEFIPAFATNCCDLRFTGGSRAIWNEEILINEVSEYLYNPEVVIIFEILDFHPMYLQAKKFDSLDIDYFYKVAWGYMRPLGLAKLHQGTIRLQLYRYVFQTRLLNHRNECTPLVYFDFIWPQKQQYSSVLNIVYTNHTKPKFQDVFERSKSIYEIERGDRNIKKKFQSATEQKSEDEIQEELSDQDMQNLRRRRFVGEKSQIPDKIIHKFASASLGCYRLCFNRKGNYLAAACTQKSSKTTIKIFDTEEGSLFAELKGHSNIIHDIKFSYSSQFLITVSSDQTAKVWKVPKNSAETIKEDESDNYLVAQLAHPSYVYAGIFISDSAMPLVATACFDSRLRIWKIDNRRTLVVQQDPEQQEVISSTGNNFDAFDDLLDHRHPNSLVYDGYRRMYVGDSLGGIHVFDINSTINSQNIANRVNYVLNPEMSGDAINCLTLIRPENKDLLVHSRDNCLRILEVNSSEGKYSESGQTTGSIGGRFFGTVTQKLSIRSTMSPCGEYVLSGSEDGKPHLWDNVSITQPTNQLQYSLIGAVTDVAWNDNYHMIALAGFGDEHPIIVYIWERNEAMNLMEYKELQERLIQDSKKKHGEDEEQQFMLQDQQQYLNQNNNQNMFDNKGMSLNQGPFARQQRDQPAMIQTDLQSRMNGTSSNMNRPFSNMGGSPSKESVKNANSPF